MTRKRNAAPAPAWVLESLPDAIVVADADGTIAYVNRAFEELTGFRRREVIGRTPALLQSGLHDRRFYGRLWRSLRNGRAVRAVFLNRRKSGALFHEEELIRRVRGPGGRVAFVSAGRDVSERVRRIEKLRHAATHDPLTGLPNRALFADRLSHGVRHAARQRESFAVAMLDLDGFKQANTRFGHAGGDAVLRAVARRTQRAVRAADTVARVGGDEFALILAGTRGRADAAAVLEKVRAANARPVRYRGKAIPVTVSIGACLYPAGGRGEAALHRRADVELYAAKRAGGDRWRLAPARRARGSSRKG
jgi:diguanylate cyclase (GGDEF)-like protein/PAS domain S-box-containing protein